ncbi:capsule biosynthesis protein [Litorisediminicola beolgyonensis]|uniref:Capsule biosynthesis protein n=1 Tax=Litorisediminicola beolgyonensis TaxID=1173614 RepID=A0ABW3ZKB6_9RHOB
MTTKPKAKKFRIRRATPPDGAEPTQQVTGAVTPSLTSARTSAAPAERPEAEPFSERPAPRATGTMGGPVPRSGEVSSARQVAAETDIEAIRAEGLTGRQLRMARRVAQRHGLEPTSDFDAVRMLRKRGIDPFQRSNMLELVPSGDDAPRPGEPDKLPQTIRAGGTAGRTQLPSVETMSPAERRAIELAKIQKELGQRRRRRFVLLMTRLSFFVILPTVLAGYYFFAVATPIYATKSEFLILKNDSAGGSGGMGGLLSGTQFATNQDAIAVQSYLASKDAMLRLDEDEGFKAHFEQAWIDPLQRLDTDASNEKAYSLYQRYVEIGYDPTEGVIRMEVMAADPEVAAEFSRALIGYAEERVDQLSQRKRSNAVLDADEALAEAEQDRLDAQERLVRLKQESAVIDPQGRIAAMQNQINTYEMQLQEKRLQLQALLDNPRPNQSRVEGVEGDIRRLDALLNQLNSDMLTATTGEDSLAEIAVQVQLAEADLATRDMMLQSALERLETARRDADSQARYLTTSVVPVASQDPSYPRGFENTLLAFLIFSGVYLMISLTASILREQVSS